MLTVFARWSAKHCDAHLLSSYVVLTHSVLTAKSFAQQLYAVEKNCTTETITVTATADTVTFITTCP